MPERVERRDGLATATSLRRVLDAAVRALAVGSDELGERVRAAAMVLGGLSRDDFHHPGDRQLVDRVRFTLMRADLAEHFPHRGAGLRASDEVLDAVAHDIVELRDRALARAVSEAAGGR
jgi:hypothetical protein